VTTVLNIVLLSLAGLSALAAIYFIAKGFQAKSKISRQAYSVGQVEIRRSSLIYWIRAAFLFFVALIFLGIFAVRPLISRVGAGTEPNPTIPAVDPGATQPETATEPAPTAGPAIESSPTGPVASPTPQATTAPTATTSPTTAVVSSGVGVWLRGTPSTSGEQLEWLLDGTVVTLLAGQETADELNWQQVRTEAGVEGWVASDFLTVNQPAP
jgi:hypothetical protein